MCKYVDLTHQLMKDMPIYPGAHELSPQIEPITSIEDAGYALSNIAMSLHVGTHIDSPAHMIIGGKTLNDYPIEHYIGPALLVDARGNDIIGEEIFTPYSINPGSIVLFYTGFDKFFYSDKERYFKQHPVFTKHAIDFLIKKKVKMVGFDLPGPDRWPFEMHKLLLKNEILIIENLTHLEQLISVDSIELYALPLHAAVDGAPARVVAQIR